MNGPDFKTKLEAATDKIKAYKAYFYDRGPSFLNTSNDSELISASKTETNRDIMSLSPTLLKRHLYANFSANNSVKENLLFSTMQNFYRKKLSLSIEKTFLDDNSEKEKYMQNAEQFRLKSNSRASMKLPSEQRSPISNI